MTMDLFDYITSNALILLPILYIFGVYFKKTPFVKDWTIPWMLLIIGIIGGIYIIGFTTDGVVQGILVTGTTVLGNQLIKQTQNKD